MEKNEGDLGLQDSYITLELDDENESLVVCWQSWQVNGKD